jgi:hypothetical protein
VKTQGRQKDRIRAAETGKKKRDPRSRVGRCWVGEEMSEGESSVRGEGTRFLYAGKADEGPCTRVAQCGRSRFPDADLPSQFFTFRQDDF